MPVLLNTASAVLQYIIRAPKVFDNAPLEEHDDKKKFKTCIPLGNDRRVFMLYTILKWSEKN